MGPRASQDLRSPSLIMAPGFNDYYQTRGLVLLLEGSNTI